MMKAHLLKMAFRNKAMLFVLAAILSNPVVSLGQEVEQEDDQQNNYTPPRRDQQPVVQYGAESEPSVEPLGDDAINAANENEEIISDGSGSGAGTGGIRQTNPRGGIRLQSGPTADSRDPGGNPDVPFDPAMNLMFLAGSVVFAYLVYKKRFAYKPAATKS